VDHQDILGGIGCSCRQI